MIKVAAMVLLFLVPSCAATTDFDDIFNLTVINGTMSEDVKYSDGCNWSRTEISGHVIDPYKWTVPPNHISAWIAIDGFKNVTTINETEYVGGCPSHLADVRYGASTSYAGFEANKDYVKRVITVRSENGNTTATMRVTFLWHWTTHSSVTGANKKHYRIEYKTVTAIRKHPAIMPSTLPPIAEITTYNNTFDPYSFIDVDVSENVTTTTFRYKDSTTTHYHKIGATNDTSSVVEYINCSIWETDNISMMGHANEHCLVRDAPLDFAKLLIQVSTPYETMNVTEYNVTQYNSKASDHIDFKHIFTYLSILSVFIGCIVINARRMW